MFAFTVRSSTLFFMMAALLASGCGTQKAKGPKSDLPVAQNDPSKQKEADKRSEFLVRMSEANKAMAAGQYQDAKTAYEKAKELLPDSEEAKNGLARAEAGLAGGINAVAKLDNPNFDPTKPDLTKTDPTKPDPIAPDPTKPVDPAKPVDPIKPADPTMPVDPTKPADPTKPVDPTKPADPTKPVDPTKPADPPKSVAPVPVPPFALNQPLAPSVDT